MRSRVDKETVCLPKTPLIHAYYSWLCNLIDVIQPSRSYQLLTKNLHVKPFYWTVPNDDNRMVDGKELRERFCNEHENAIFTDEFFNDECSMLELLIALAYRCEGIMVDQCGNMKMCKWYWTMITNVGLSKYTDEVYYDIDGELNVDSVLNRIIDRTYQRNGHGGLFPVNHTKADQRKVELWYQMSTYLVENYYEDE